MTRLARNLCKLILALASASCGSPCSSTSSDFVPVYDPRISVMGRADRSDREVLRIGYPGVTLRVRFEGPSLALRARSTTDDSYLTVVVDGTVSRKVRLGRSEQDIVLFDEATKAGPHTIEVVHQTETWRGIVAVRGFLVGSQGRLHAPTPWPERRILFIGDSITCGEGAGLGRPSSALGMSSCTKDSTWWDPYFSYGMQIARTLDAQCHLVCFGGRGLTRDWQGRTDVLNAPQFFDLAVPDEKTRPRWDHTGYVPHAVVVSLGTNDFSLGIGELPARETFVSAYVEFVRAIRARYPGAEIFLTEGAMVNDDADSRRPQKTVLRGYIAETVRRLADPRVHAVDATHYPGDRCDSHPTRDQHDAMARDWEPVLRAALQWR
jgi:lysophospholipase L1-like esterase